MRDGRRVIAVIMGAFGKNGEIDRGKSRDLRAIDLVERAFVALPPGAMFTRATEVGRPVEDPIPTVRTERSAPREQASTAESEPFKFRLNLPEQKK
jgi:D-alanyl-D-alanine carboxypeptidase